MFLKPHHDLFITPSRRTNTETHTEARSVSYEAKVKTGRLQSVIEHVATPPQGVGSAWGEDLAPQRGLEPNQAKLCQALKQTHSAPFSASQLL